MHLIKILVTLLVLILACSQNKANIGYKPATVFTKKLQYEEISDQLIYPAKIYSKVNATVLSESSGVISEMRVTLGQSLKRNEVLMKIRHTDPVYQYAPFEVRSPIDGVLSAIDVTLGSYVVTGQTLAFVIHPKQLEVIVEVPAPDLAQVVPGLRGELRVLAHEDSLGVEVFGVSPFIKPVTGTASAKMKILGPLTQLTSPGLQGQVQFKVNRHTGFLISDSAIVYKGKGLFVRVLEGLKIRQIPVELGKKQNGRVEVLKGLKPDTILVERSSRSVAEGEEVVLEEPAPGTSLLPGAGS